MRVRDGLLGVLPGAVVSKNADDPLAQFVEDSGVYSILVRSCFDQIPELRNEALLGVMMLYPNLRCICPTD